MSNQINEGTRKTKRSKQPGRIQFCLLYKKNIYTENGIAKKNVC